MHPLSLFSTVQLNNYLCIYRFLLISDTFHCPCAQVTCVHEGTTCLGHYSNTNSSSRVIRSFFIKRTSNNGGPIENIPGSVQTSGDDEWAWKFSDNETYQHWNNSWLSLLSSLFWPTLEFDRPISIPITHFPTAQHQAPLCDPPLPLVPMGWSAYLTVHPKVIR